MLALVLSGGANYGAMQAGALEVLFEAGLRPQMIVGTSAGAVNAIHIAADPTPEGAHQLSDHWRLFAQEGYGAVRFSNLRRLVAKGSLFPSEPVVEFLTQRNPPVETFGQLMALHNIRVYTTAVCMETGYLRIFVDRGDDLLLDGAMASSALAPFFSPWEVDGAHYLDGAVAAKLPIRVAVERGATKVIALNNAESMVGPSKLSLSARGVSARAISLVKRYQTESEIAWARTARIPLRVINLPAPKEVPTWDYQQADYLIELGRELATRSLKDEPLKLHRSRWALTLDRVLTKMRGKRN